MSIIKEKTVRPPLTDEQKTQLTEFGLDVSELERMTIPERQAAIVLSCQINQGQTNTLILCKIIKYIGKIT